MLELAITIGSELMDITVIINLCHCAVSLECSTTDIRYSVVYYLWIWCTWSSYEPQWKIAQGIRGAEEKIIPSQLLTRMPILVFWAEVMRVILHPTNTLGTAFVSSYYSSWQWCYFCRLQPDGFVMALPTSLSWACQILKSGKIIS